MRLKRAERHEAMLRARLEACRASEAKARAAAEQAWAEAREAGRRTAAALQSRCRLAVRIIDADGPSELQAIARTPQVIEWAKRAEDDDEALPFGFGQ